MKRILDSTFKYRPSFDTDIRRTFSAYRRRRKATEPAATSDGKVALLADARTRGERGKS
jgi:hypothetical protein